MRLALYQPDIPQNTGTLLRTAACLEVGIDIIAPAGFDMSDRALRRAGLDYLATADMTRHASFAAFEAWRHGAGRRLVLASTRAGPRYTDFSFRSDDVVLLGRESAGVPHDVADAADAAIRIPMRQGARSLNVAIAGGMILGEALRQVRWLGTTSE